MFIPIGGNTSSSSLLNEVSIPYPFQIGSVNAFDQMRFFFKLQRCLNHCHAERRERYKTIETLYDRYDLEVAEARLRTIDYIFAFMGSAIDLKYPFLEGGFKNNLPDQIAA